VRIAHVAAEVTPWCSSGGLGQVMAALPAAIGRRAGAGDTVAAYFPLCRAAAAAATAGELTLTPAQELDGATLLRAESAEPVELFFIDAPQYFDRPQLYGPYGDPYPDDAERFAFLAQTLMTAWQQPGGPEVVHCHDWHTGLLPGLASDRATVFTIHNLAYQGVFGPSAAAALGAAGPTISFMESAIIAADVVTTVSPTYAREILTDGAGLDQALAARRAPIGILNGIDIEEWNPVADPLIPRQFAADDLDGKDAVRTALCDSLGLEVEAGDLVVGVVSRFVEQKGIDLMIEVAAESAGLRFAMLGDGDPELEDALTALARKKPGTVAVRLGWNKPLAHLIIAGADVVAIPSRFEPCGLTQMQSMRYGTIPVAHAVGGLSDTIDDPGDDALGGGRGSGFTFAEPTAAALQVALQRAAGLHRHPEAWRTLQRTVMGIDWSWDGPAAAYLDLYAELLR
jgi:starch synthase